jgi:hypothetical protein
MFLDILSVHLTLFIFILVSSFANIFNQILHKFQQALSGEKPLMLCDAISHFHAIIQVW